jgi:hypothetical protein
MIIECKKPDCRFKIEVPRPQSADPETSSHPQLTKTVPEEITVICPICKTFNTAIVYVTRHVGGV